jgi:raffinose/stachyose/melibiose transport system permease protein
MTTALRTKRPPPRAHRTGDQRRKPIAFAYIAPAIVMYAVFFVWPFTQLVVLSLQEWNGFGDRTFVGFDNYTSLVRDRVFWISLRHNLAWTLAAMVIPVGMGLMLAILLTRTAVRGRAIFRAIYFFPQVVSSISVAVAWSWIYNPSYGLLNQVLGSVGLESVQTGWLGNPSTALPALFIAWSWIHYGFTMVIFIAALESINESFFEAAKLDGAGWWAQLRYILLPLIRRPFTTVLLVTAISAFQVFDIIFALTNGGPGRATMVLPLYMLDSAFTFRKIGYGASLAVVMGIIMFSITMILLRIRRAFDD